MWAYAGLRGKRRWPDAITRVLKFVQDLGQGWHLTPGSHGRRRSSSSRGEWGKGSRATLGVALKTVAWGMALACSGLG
eukprot:scaffold149467_cov19-Tisochrysis_lutea.AAC.1